MKYPFTTYYLGFMVTLIVLLAGCVVQPVAGPAATGEGAGNLPTVESLDGTKWQLATLQQEPIPAEAGITLEFTDGTISGSSGCNNYSGAYRITTDKIEFFDTVSTTMACVDEQRMRLEASYSEQLLEVTAFQSTADQLTLMNAQGEPLLVFTAN